MPRFFFHLVDRVERINDDEGLVLPNAAFAREELPRLLTAVLKEEYLEDKLRDWHLRVEDESGREVVVLPLRDFVLS
jgi:hypothetical protein